MLPRLLCVAVCVLASLEAQHCVYNVDADPTMHDDRDSLHRGLFGGYSSSSSGWRKSQVVVSRHEFDNVPVLITGLAVSAHAARLASFRYVEVRMGYTSRDVLDPVFVNNITSVMTTVLEAHDYRWPQKMLAWNECGLQTPFLFVPAAGNLLIEVVVGDAPTQFLYAGRQPANALGVFLDAEASTLPLPASGTISIRAPKLRLCIDTPHLGYYGESCAGSAGTFPGLGLTGSSRIGERTTFVLSNTLPNAPASLLLSLSNRSPLPIDLTAIGMTGCRLYVGDLLSYAAVFANAQGVASFSLTMPTGPEFVGAILYSQYFVGDPAANPFGLVPTNYGRLSVGL
jgi:hypothetical protein